MVELKGELSFLKSSCVPNLVILNTAEILAWFKSTIYPYKRGSRN